MVLAVDEYVEMWKHRFEEQEKEINEIRSIKHDMQAHMIVLQYYLEAGEYDRAKDYLQKMRQKEYTKAKEVDIETGMSLIDAIIKEYLKKSSSPIRFVLTGELPVENKVDDYDWCTMFSNLMSNATEACQKLQRIEKVIHLEISTDGEKIDIVMSNPIEWNVDKEMLEKSTTKKEKNAHGFGLKNVRKVVEKYNGSIDYGCESDEFTVKISFPKSGIEK